MSLLRITRTISPVRSLSMRLAWVSTRRHVDASFIPGMRWAYRTLPYRAANGALSIEGEPRAERIVRVAREERLSLRGAAYRFGVWRADFVGSPKTIADAIEQWFVEKACDGFNFRVSRPPLRPARTSRAPMCSPPSLAVSDARLASPST